MEKVYAVVYSEDEFKGISMPIEYEPFLRMIEEDSPEFLYNVTTIVKDHRDYERQVAWQSREPSHGTEYLNDINEFYGWFSQEEEMDEVENYLSGMTYIEN